MDESMARVEKIKARVEKRLASVINLSIATKPTSLSTDLRSRADLTLGHEEGIG